MGKKSHPPRGGTQKPLTNAGEDTSFIVFSNSKDDPKSKSKGTGNRDAANGDAKKASDGKAKTKEDVSQTEDVAKKPDTRTLIGGASWTGKLPLNILSEHCQKQKWEKPEFTMTKTPEGFLSTVILKKKDPKTQEVTSLPPIRLPPTHKHLAFQPSAVEARHFAATYALFRTRSMQNIHMMLPPSYRDLWKGEFQSLKDEDMGNGKGWIYEGDPFLAQKSHDEGQREKVKRREAQEKERAARAKENGTLSGGLQSKGWKAAPIVEMGKSTRRDVEGVVRAHGIWNQHGLTIPDQSLLKIADRLTRLGFRQSHIEEAASICKDMEEIIEWLIIHVPEDDLPLWCLPEGYTAGVTMASGNIKRESAIKRLAAVGYAIELCEDTYDAYGGNEILAAEKLQLVLLGVDKADLRSDRSPAHDSFASEDEVKGAELWKEELEVVKSIYGDRFEPIDKDGYRIHLDVPSVKDQIHLQVRKPCSIYPQNLPVLAVEAKLPAYIRLSILRQVLTYANGELGEQMILNLVNWLEQEIADIIARPGKLSDVSPVITQSRAIDRAALGKNSSRKKTRHPKPVNWQHGSSTSLKILSEWELKRSNPKLKQMIIGRQSLPAWKLQESIVQAVNTHQVVIISGETGSGKSTQSVQFILDDMIHKQIGEAANIICTQPRRISALGLADRVADERCSIVGQEIGYAIRGDSKRTNGVTKITFMTTGVLLRRLQTSGGSTDDVVAALADVSHVIVDEVHERTLDTDFLLALLRDVLKKRKDLKIILMSATLDAGMFEKYFGGPNNVGRVEIQGRTYPVDDFYVDDVVSMIGYRGWNDEVGDLDTGSTDPSVAGIVQRLGMGINYNLISSLVQRIDKDLGTQEGGILIFLPGTMEINRTIDGLRDLPNLHALPLHASLLPTEQKRVFPPAPRGKRKVIVATNVAETSITIEDIVVVIDTGRVKETRFDPQNKIVKLEEVWASQAACKQRRGRAGRVRAGKCYKLFTRNAEARMMERPEPEIRRVPLEQLCLSVKAMGVSDVKGFLQETLTPPEIPAIEGALELLRRMGALYEDVLTPLGRHLAMIPADLRCGKLMVYGATFGCLEASVTIASILTARSPFVSPQGKREEADAIRLTFAKEHGDVIGDLCAYEAWAEKRVVSSYRDVRSWCDRNFLSFQTLNEIYSTRTQYLMSLKEIGFIPLEYSSLSSQFSHTRYDRNASSLALLRALIAGAFSPQVARIQRPDKKYTSTMTGALELDPEAKTIKYFTESSELQSSSKITASATQQQALQSVNTRVFIHPSSTLFHTTNYSTSTAFLSYFTQIATSKLFIRDLTPCSAYGLLLFGGSGVSIDLDGRGLVVDGWARLRGWARIGVLVGRLRGVLDSVLESRIENPGMQGDVANIEREDEVVRIVRKLVELDGMDR